MIYEDVQKISNAAVAKITLLKNHFGKDVYKRQDITCGPILGTQAMSFCAARRQGYERFHV